METGTDRLWLPPTTVPASVAFWDALGDGELLLDRCRDCDTFRFPPSPCCGTCRSTETTAVAASGRGSIYSFCRPDRPAATPEGTDVVVLVELEEGVRIVSNLSGGEPRIGAPVEVEFVEHQGTWLHRFRLVEP